MSIVEKGAKRGLTGADALIGDGWTMNYSHTNAVRSIRRLWRDGSNGKRYEVEIIESPNRDNDDIREGKQ